MESRAKADFQRRLDLARAEEDFQRLYAEIDQVPKSDPDRWDLGEQTSMVALTYGIDLDNA